MSNSLFGHYYTYKVLENRRNYGPLNTCIHYGKILQDETMSVLLNGTPRHMRNGIKKFKKKE